MIDLLFYFVGFLYLVIYIKLKYFKSKREKILLKVPGPKYSLVFGNTFSLVVKREDRLNNFLSILKAFPESPLVRIWLANTALVFVTKASAAEALLSSTRWLDKSFTYRALSPWLGDGLLLSAGAKWKSRRRMLTPAFHFGILERFLLTINEHAIVLIDTLKKEQLGKEAFNFYPYATRCTLDIICETAMGTQLNAQTLKNTDYVNAVSGLQEILMYRDDRPWLRPDFIFKRLPIGKLFQKFVDINHKFTRNVIQTRKREFLEARKNETDEIESESDKIYGIKRRLAFLDLLIYMNVVNEEIDDEGIQEEVDTFMFEGHDTTASALSWTIYNIGRFPEIQKKVQSELDIVLGRSELKSVSSSQLNQLKYLECVLKESMRLFPPVPFYSRLITEDIKLCGFDIPKQTTFRLALQMIHTDPENFPDPLTFNPDRFLSENESGRNPFSFVSFSAGPRNCIGQRFAMMELKTVLAHILHKFLVTAIFNGPEDLQSYAEQILRHIKGHWIQLEERI